jgi:mannosyltransferase OCH1-like enzyme
MPIPKRIIQTGKSRELGLTARISSTNLRLLHPDWEYIYFDDAAISSFIAQEFPHYQAVFEAFPRSIQRIDFFRYLAVYRMGGFYFDLDVILARGLHELAENESVFPFEELSMNKFLDQEFGLNWEIGNYAFGAAAGDTFLEAIIENCVRAQKDPRWVRPMMNGIPRLLMPDFTVLNTTGPGLISRTLAEFQGNQVTVLMPEDIYRKENWHRFGDFGIHLMEGSWHSKSDFWRRIAWWRITRSMRSRNRMRQRLNKPAFSKLNVCLAPVEG